MASFKLHMRDGSVIDHAHEGRAGGSYTKEIEYVPGFAIITDEWGRSISYPERDIARIERTPVCW